MPSAQPYGPSLSSSGSSLRHFAGNGSHQPQPTTLGSGLARQCGFLSCFVMTSHVTSGVSPNFCGPPFLHLDKQTNVTILILSKRSRHRQHRLYESKPDKTQLYYLGMHTWGQTKVKKETIVIKAKQRVPAGRGKGCERERPLGDPGILVLFVLS